MVADARGPVLKPRAGGELVRLRGRAVQEPHRCQVSKIDDYLADNFCFPMLSRLRD
jgi:hypothetical protein